MKYIKTTDFVTQGYLQEVNRVVLHPLGLALEVTEKEGVYNISGIQDYRHDPEGVIFGILDMYKLDSIREEEKKRFRKRMDRLGYIIQGE